MLFSEISIETGIARESLHKSSLKINHVKFHCNLPGANELHKNLNM